MRWILIFSVKQIQKRCFSVCLNERHAFDELKKEIGVWSFPLRFLRINRSINQMQCNAIRYDAILINACYSLSSNGVSRVVFCVGHLRSFNKQSQWADSPHRIDMLACTCELAFHEANHVRLVELCDLSNESNDYKTKNNGYRTNCHASCIMVDVGRQRQ